MEIQQTTRAAEQPDAAPILTTEYGSSVALAAEHGSSVTLAAGNGGTLMAVLGSLMMIAWILNFAEVLVYISGLVSAILSIVMLTRLKDVQTTDTGLLAKIKTANITNIIVNGVIFLVFYPLEIAMWFVLLGWIPWIFSTLGNIGMGVWMLMLWLEMKKEA
jgi:hypothetical protein